MNEATLVLPEQTQRGNIWRLVLAHALAGANSVVIYATGAVVGNDLAPSKMLATLRASPELGLNDSTWCRRASASFRLRSKMIIKLSTRGRFAQVHLWPADILLHCAQASKVFDHPRPI